MSDQSSSITGGAIHTNKLSGETSTYLLQHAHNPVDWHPWGKEALDLAHTLQRPILLSIGYSACHWCHVMEHESFENQETAKLMNDNFVCIKVDREERPDLDEIYMRAVQMLTGHGGWPLTVFLTPELKPFFGGTYYPPEDRHGLPGFKHVLIALSEAWRHKRQEIEDSSQEITDHLSAMDKLPNIPGLDQSTPPTSPADARSTILKTGEKILALFDHTWGGFGNSPKFPHTFSISLGMRCLSHLCQNNPSLKSSLLNMVSLTLDKMAYGGINDQIGGGFSRYSVDRKWLIPHFEKMLYDNALLCQNYIDAYILIGRNYWIAVAEDILNFLLREMRTSNGAFYSSLDADSEGQEGKYYVWSLAEIETIMGSDSGFFASVYGVSKSGNFEHGKNVLHLTASPEELATQFGISLESFYAKLKPMCQKLFAARSKRKEPGLDQKVLTSWNSLVISAFVDGYKATGKDEYLHAAVRAAKFIESELICESSDSEGRVGKTLLRTWGRGKAKLNGYLDDYAYYVRALLDLASVDGDPCWANLAYVLTERMLHIFSDEKQVGFYYSAHDHNSPLARPRSHFDSSLPSPTAVAVFNLVRLSRLSGESKFEARARLLFDLYQPLFTQMPDQFCHFTEALDFSEAKTLEIVLVRSGNTKVASELLLEIHRHYLPNKVVLIKDMLQEVEGKTEALPKFALLEHRNLIKGEPAVYICENFACQAPITSVAALAEKLKILAPKIKQPKSS